MNSKHTTIKECCELITSGGTPSRRNSEFFRGNINWFKTQELNDGNLYDSEEKITESALRNSSAKMLPENTVSIAMYGATVGKLGILKKGGTTNQAFCNMIVNKNSDYKFLFYWLMYQRPNLIKLASGAAQQNLNLNIISNFNIPIFDLKKQKLISKFLSTIDQKIELNHKINKNLEELAQIIYKKWFVDFEFPNEEGKPYKSSGGGMVDSELGLIPKGWRLETLGNSSISSLIKTGVSKFEGTKTYIATADVSGIDIVSFKTKITLEDKPSRANMQPVSNSLWFAKMKNSRKLIRVSSTSRYLLNRCIFSTGFAGLLVPDYPNYIWSFLISKEFDDMKNNLSNGTTMEGINNDGINRIKIIIPKKEILSKFENTINSFYEEIQFLQIQNNKLADLRDLLLPKLMSGEIEVPDME